MREGKGGVPDRGDEHGGERVGGFVRFEGIFASGEGTVPVRSGAGDFDGNPDGVRGHGGDSADGGAEFDER